MAGGTAPLPATAQERVLSLDYCADQYVMALADGGNILAVSPAAASEYSYLADRAQGLAALRPTGEQVLLADPDLVIRQWGGGYNAAAYLDRFGIPVVQVSFGTTVDSVRENLRRIADALNARPRAEALIADMDRRLARVRAGHAPRAARPYGLYVTPGGVTSGAGTFVHTMMEAAGVRNIMAVDGKTGWRGINLETLALRPPDLIIGAFFDLKSNHVNHWSIARHSFLKDMMETTPTVFIPGAQVACSGWFFADAVENIHRTARTIQTMQHPTLASRE
ncbi:ABC transporter substrate-binding protein [Eilatimonas milleporae]|nr:ABC transporter substrate-binding protein [Eilatimonas milleporae]